MRILVCKYNNSFIEPCCAQTLLLKDGHYIFSSDVWAGYAFLKIKHDDCEYKEIQYLDESQIQKIFSEYSHIVFYAPFPRSLDKLHLLTRLTNTARDAGCGIVYIGKDLGFAQEMLEKGHITADVFVTAFDTQAALAMLEEEGFFRSAGTQGEPRLLSNSEVPLQKYTHGSAGFLDVKEEVSRYDYRSLPLNRKQRCVSAGLGCPHSCTYCMKRRTKWQAKEPELLAREVAFWDGLPLELYHNNLFHSRSWLKMFLDALSAYPRNREIRTLGRIDDVHRNLDLLQLLEAAGITRIDVGFESANPRVLKNMRKEANDLGKLDDICDEAKRLGIAVQMNVLLGMPEEDETSIEKTYEVFRRYASTMNVTLLRPQPGTPVYDELVEAGLLGPSDRGLENFLGTMERLSDGAPYVATKHLSKEDLMRWHKKFRKNARDHY